MLLLKPLKDKWLCSEAQTYTMLHKEDQKLLIDNSLRWTREKPAAAESCADSLALQRQLPPGRQQNILCGADTAAAAEKLGSEAVSVLHHVPGLGMHQWLGRSHGEV